MICTAETSFHVVVHSSYANTFQLYSKLWNTWQVGASPPGVLGVQHTPYANSSLICVHNAWFNHTSELLSSCHSVMLSLNFGAPALEKLAVLDFLSSQLTCYWFRWRDPEGWGETAVVDIGWHAASHKHSLCSCRRLVSVAPRKHYRVVILSLFPALFYIIFVFGWYAASLQNSIVF